jgi:hypothetical protein
MKECPRCKSAQVVKGSLGNGDTSLRQIFRPEDLKFLVLSLLSGVPVDAYACCECGFVWSETDPDELNEFVEKHCNTKLP